MCYINGKNLFCFEINPLYGNLVATRLTRLFPMINFYFLISRVHVLIGLLKTNIIRDHLEDINEMP